MTGKWAVIIPETSAVTNLVTNPSIETATTGYAGISASVAASAAYSRRGYQSLAVTPTATTTDGAFYDAVTLVSGTTYILAFDFRGAAGIPYIAAFGDTAGNMQTAAGTSITGTGDWQRITHTYASTASAAFRVYITKNGNASTAVYYLDGVGVYALDHDPQHIDGDQVDCYWTGTAHASTSARKANSRNGGEAVNFDDYAFYISEWPGAGMAEIDPYSLPYSVLPGSDDQGEKIIERNFSLVGDVAGSSLADLHSKRKALISAFKPGAQLWLVYSGGNANKPVRIRCKYVGGLSMGKPEGFTERVALKFLATDPLWYEDGDEGAALTTTLSVANSNSLLSRIGGTWSAWNTTLTSVAAPLVSVEVIVRNYKESYYIGGTFTSGASSSNCGRVCEISSGGTLTALGTPPDGAIYALAPTSAGVYAGGNFSGTTDTGSNVSYWNGSAWTALGNSVSGGFPYDLEIDDAGNLYAAGSFTSASAVANTGYIAKWDGAAWTALGNGGTGTIYDIAFGLDGTLYAAGNLSGSAGTSDAENIAKWNGTAWTALGTGTNGTVNCLAVGRDGKIYAGGAFTTAGGNSSCAYLAAWNGAAWEAVGDGVGAAVTSIAIDDNGLIYVGGTTYTRSAYGGGYIPEAKYTRLWNGATWTDIPLQLPSSTDQDLRAILPDGDDLFLGFAYQGTAVTPALNTVTNSGTMKAYPRIVIKRTGGTKATVEYIKNETNGATLWLYYELREGETLTIDTALGRRAVTSSFSGNVVGKAMLRNSELANFCLEPGANSISAYVYTTGTPTITAYLYYPVTHYSLDGSST